MRRAVYILITVFSLAAMTVASVGFIHAVTANCDASARQYDVLRHVIVQQNTPEPASPIIIKAFPEFKPFFTPGTPQYNEAKRLNDDKLHRILAKLGDRPSC